MSGLVSNCAVIGSHELAISSEEDIVLVRRKVRALAQARKLDSFAVAALTTATSELTRNVWVHGGGGSALLEELADGRRYGVRATFVDQGPGVSDLERALAGGFSTTKTMGLGLSGSRRLVDAFSIQTGPGGTRIQIEKWGRG
jgi:serine/threonine-protein kinase RsbT